jgi:hypothetical protein
MCAVHTVPGLLVSLGACNPSTSPVPPLFTTVTLHPKPALLVFGTSTDMTACIIRSLHTNKSERKYNKSTLKRLTLHGDAARGEVGARVALGVGGAGGGIFIL